jgi:predicted metal-dependent enzyme (double-stranded beta helix superfamily)
LDVVAPDVLEAVAADLALTVSPDFENPVADARRHRQLVRTASYDAWLIGWGPSSLLELHDHGGSVGAIRVIQGELIETYSDKLHRHPLRSLSVGAGGRHFVPATRIHEVWNPGPSPALSVHVYSPPLTAMTFFDRSLSPLRTEYGNAASLD